MPMVADVADAVIGGDTHKDTHTLEMATPSGVPLASIVVGNDAAGGSATLAWITDHALGPRVVVGLEGTRSYGIGLARALRAAGLTVVEVERPKRETRRRRGKSDPIDAHLAVLAVLRMHTDRLPTPRADGDREALRILLTARAELTDTYTRQINQLRALLLTGDDTDRAISRGRVTRDWLDRLIRRRGPGTETREQATRRAETRRLAQAIRDAHRDLTRNRDQLTAIITDLAPDLLDHPGVGPVSAAQTIVSWSHPGRCRTEAAFAALAGVNPIPASSGKTVRHRLNRGGDRHLNHAPHTIALTRMRSCPRTHAYLTRRRSEGKPTATSAASSTATSPASSTAPSTPTPLDKHRSVIARSSARRLTPSRRAGFSWCGRTLAGVTDHMTPDEFRKYGHQAVEWIAAYYERLESFPVLSTVKPGEIRAALPADPPEHGEGFDTVLRDLDAILLPGITHWQHPSFFAYFPANASGPGILGDLLASGLGVQGMIWATSPAATELETHVLDWLAALLDLPPRFRSDGRGAGVIQHSASDAALVALLAAIHRATGGRTARTGVGTERLTVYTSSQTHSSVEKACRVAGLGTNALRTIDVDPATWAARPDQLRHLIEADRAAGYTPALVVASVGTTGVGAIDPVAELGQIARSCGAWLHVDAAWAGVAAVCPELRWLNEGLEFADSYCTNPHKWLLTNFDCDAMWVAERDDIVAALSILPEYLRNAATESGQVIDYRDWHVPLGRRFRALKLWAVIRWYGAEGLCAHVRADVALAQEFASWVAGDDRFELVGPHPLSLVTFRLRSGDEATRHLMERVNAAGRMYLTHTAAGDRLTLRMAIGSPQTERRHVAAAWAELQQAADA